MAAAKKKRRNKTIFNSIRKPVAPPSRKLGEEKPVERAHPAERKVKHKQKVMETDD